MAESSKGKHHLGPSKLKHVQQPPDCDTVVPETQLGTVPESDYGGGDDVDISMEDLALMEMLSCKKPAASTATCSPTSAAPVQMGILTRPASAKTEEPEVFARQLFKKAPPKKNEPPVKPIGHPDSAMPSVELSSGKNLSQDHHNTAEPSSWLRTATIKERVTETPPAAVIVVKNQDQDQNESEGPTPVEPAHAELFQLQRSRTPANSQITPHTSAQGSPAFMKKRTGTKVKRARKIPLIKRLNLAPLQSGPSSGLSITQDTKALLTNDIAPEFRVGANKLQSSMGSFAVKPCSSAATTTDGPLETRQVALAMPIDAANNSPVADGRHVETITPPNQTTYAQPNLGLHTDSHQPSGNPHVSTNGNDSSMSDPSEIHDHHLQAQPNLVLEPQVSGGSSSVPLPHTARRNGPSKPRSVFKLLPTHNAKTLAQQQLLADEHDDVGPTDSPPSRSRRVQDLLYDVSSRARPIRVTKSPKHTQTSHGTYTTFPVWHQQVHVQPTGLENALDAFRNAYLRDQQQLKEQMATNEKAWQLERSDLQTLITEREELIAEQRVKIEQSEEQSEKRFTDFASELTLKLKSSQKFVAGLQRDHEKAQQSTFDIHEQNKKALQIQITQVLQEKEDLQAEFDAMVESCRKSQKNMSGTMHEIQLRYIKALLRENGLKLQLNERETMYEEEKQRRTELEQQLLPSVQTIQHQLSKSCTTLAEEIGGLRASMESRTDENSCDSTVKQCLLTLQQLQPLPLLTLKDVHKVECMLQDLSAKTDSNSKLIASIPKYSPISIEAIRDCIHDEMQGLQEDILRNHRAIAASQFACEANQRLATGLENEKQKVQQLEEQTVSLQRSEAALLSHVTLLEQERDELRNVVEGHQAERRESEQNIAQLEAQLRTITEDLRTSSAAAHGNKRQYLKEMLNFCKYRADALDHLDDLRKHIRKITDDGSIKARDGSALKRDVAELRAQLDLEQTKTDKLKAKIAQYDRDANIIKQEKNDAIEKEGRTRESLQTAENSNLELNNEKFELSLEIEGTRKDLLASKVAEEKLTLECSDLHKQVNALHDSKGMSDRQLRQVQHDTRIKLHQAETAYTTSLNELKSSLKLSEDACKELQATLRQEEAGRKSQIENHDKKFNDKFSELVAQSRQDQEKLIFEHRQELERCERDAEARVALATQAAQRRIDEALEGKVDKAAEKEGQSKVAETSTVRTLVPNTQQFEQNTVPSSQESQTGRTRKMVDRQTNIVTVVASSSHRQLGPAASQLVIGKTTFAGRHREDSETSTGYIGQEIENRLDSQALIETHEEQLSMRDPEAEIVPETQDFQYGQGFAAQFEIIESQIVTGDNAEDDDLIDLSTVPSEDLSEMLMDVRPTSQQHQQTPKHASRTGSEPQTPVQSAHDRTLYAHSTSSRGRPKSRANTASRIMPLPHQNEQRQHMYADQGHDHMSQTRAEQSYGEGNNDSLDSMHTNRVVSERTYRPRSGHDTESGQKRKSSSNDNDSGSFKRLRASAQEFAQRLSSMSKSHAPYVPPPAHTPAQNNSSHSPVSMTGRRSNYRQSSVVASRSATPRLSSTRNTRSKAGNRYNERFADELDSR